MQIDSDQLRRHYAALPDDVLLEMQREDLTEIALEYFDAELRRRGLAQPQEPDDDSAHVEPGPEDSKEWGEARRLFMRSVPWAKQAISLHTFQFAPEAEDARDALDAAGIPNAIAGEEKGGLRFQIMVPETHLEAARRILDAAIFHPAFEDTLEKHFAVFTDEELLAVEPELLPDTARASYEEELEERGLGVRLQEARVESTSGESAGMVTAATLLGGEGEVAQRILADAGIRCVLEEDGTPAPLEDFQSVRLMVAPEHVDEASRILEENMQKILDEVRGEE